MRQEVQRNNGENLNAQLAALDGIKAVDRTTDSAGGKANAYFRSLSTDEQKYSDMAVEVARTVKAVLPILNVQLGGESAVKLSDDAQTSLKGILAGQIVKDLRAMYSNSHELSSNNTRYYAMRSHHMSVIRDSATNVLGALALIERNNDSPAQALEKLSKTEESLKSAIRELDAAIPEQAEIDDDEWRTLQFERSW